MCYRAIVLVGPTAVGKTSLSIKLAKKLNASIISADSTQIYKGLDIATAKITEEEKEGVEHYLIDIINPLDDYSVSNFKEDTEKLLESSENFIIVGGTGLYINVLNKGISNVPESDNKLREELEQKELDELLKILFELDEKTYNRIDRKNKVRVVRAIEICKLTNKILDEVYKEEKEIKFRFLNILLTRDRENLYNRINKRVDIMLNSGMLEEGKKIFEKYGHDMSKIKAIGYNEMYQYFIGNITYDEMVSLIKKNSRHYAKRQITWFKNKDYIEFNLDYISENDVIDKIIEIWR